MPAQPSFFSIESRRNRLLPLAFGVGALVLGACGSGEDEHPSELDGFGAGAWEEDDGSILFGAPAADDPKWHQENRRRRDPAADDWRSESLHELAKKALGGLFEATLESHEGHEPADFLAAGFEARPGLDRAAFAEVRSQGAFRVARWRGATDETQGASALDWAAFAENLFAPFAAPAELHPHFKIVRVDAIAEASFRTEVLLHTGGRARAEGTLQWNGRWMLAWHVVGADESVRLAGLEVLEHEEVHGPSEFLTDVTGSVFGGVPRFRQELLRGVPEYFRRTDFSLVGNSLPGMHGVAVGDLDGDGRDDVYLPQQGGLPNRLFLNRPDGRVVDVGSERGVAFLDDSRSALIADFDADGHQDLIVSSGALLVVLWNAGEARFVDSTPLRAPGPEEIYSLGAADPDGDGDLDLYACRYSSRDSLSNVPMPYHDANNGAPNVFWRNEGARGFVDATEELGFGENNRKYSYACVWDDFDGDGDADLYVANDFGLNNLFRNEGGFFRDVAAEVGAQDKSSGMGVSVGDYDLDGDPDLYVTNMFSSAGSRTVRNTTRYADGAGEELEADHYRFARGNTLLANRGDGTFEDRTVAAGVAVGGWAWGAKFVDLDNDGRPDLYSPNGYITNRDPDDT